MRNVLKNHSEVAHFWANKVQPSGKACNMFYDDDFIYDDWEINVPKINDIING